VTNRQTWDFIALLFITILTYPFMVNAVINPVYAYELYLLWTIILVIAIAWVDQVYIIKDLVWTQKSNN